MNKQLLGWIAGIVAAVLSSLITYYLTRPPSITTFEGMVYSGSAAVPNAFVELDLTGTPGANGPLHDQTDPQGAYKIQLTGLSGEVNATLRVTVKGYQTPAPKLFAKVVGQDVRFDVGLDPLKAPLPPVIVGGAAVPAPPTAVTRPLTSLPQPMYIPKLAEQAARFKIPPA